MVNPAMIFKMKSMWDEFTANHPKLPRFFQAADQPVVRGRNCDRDDHPVTGWGNDYFKR